MAVANSVDLLQVSVLISEYHRLSISQTEYLRIYQDRVNEGIRRKGEKLPLSRRPRAARSLRLRRGTTLPQ